MLTASAVDRAAYEAQGFLRVPGVLSQGDLDRLRVESDRMLAERADTRTWDGLWRQSFPNTTPQEPYNLLTVPDLHRHSNVWHDAAHASPLLAVIEGLIGPCQLVAAMLIVKPPAIGQPFPLHQDSAYYGSKETSYCIVVVHLDATTHENGALRFLPGRHRDGVLPHLQGGKAHLDPAVYRLDETVEVPADAGDLVCFSLHTPHASYPNRSKLPRTVVRLGYVPA